MSEDIFCMREDRVASYILFTFANSCMPTLMKTKPSCLISFHKRYITQRYSFFNNLNRELSKFQCEYEVLYESESIYYILVYNKKLLEEALLKYHSHFILANSGYKANKGFHYNIKNFCQRFKEYKGSKVLDFPHEVGIFLGYPIKDVEEYIKNNGENYIVCGYWKVYDNIEEADKTFQLFKEMREMAIKIFFSGRELCELQMCS